MRTLSTAEIKSYLKQDRPYHCAGSYKIEEHGIALFEKIQTPDYFSIIGLPLISLGKYLREKSIIN
jgi:septum formation protein